MQPAGHLASAQPYDVFMSLGGLDREPVRELVRALRKAGLTVFLDEDRIPLFVGVTAEIEAALRSAKLIVVYYSASYPSRSACQFELTAAYLAGLAEGDPSRRIVVINPELGTDHLQPVELADDRFAVLPAPGGERRAMAAIVMRIRARVDAITGGIGGVPLSRRPRWYAERTPGQHGFVGRYRDQWRLHSALHHVDRPLTQEIGGAPVAAVVGLPGVGKTALAAAYAWQFGAAFLGGVFWVSLVGPPASAEEILGRYADTVRGVAERLGLRVGRADRAQVFGQVADWIAAQPAPSLWVVDDVPPDLEPEILGSLLIPAGTQVRTLVISQRLRPGWLASTVEIGPMTTDDAVMLLRGFREPDSPADARALERVAVRLDGHAHALTFAGRELADRQGLLSIVDYPESLASKTVAAIAQPVRAAMSNLDSTQQSVLRLFVAWSPAVVPVELVDRTLSSLVRAPRASVGAALAELRRRLLLHRNGTVWQMHSIVRDAAHEHLGPLSAEVAGFAADAIVALLAEDAVLPASRTLLIRHGEAVAARDDLARVPHEALLRNIADYYESRGEPILAVSSRERILSYDPAHPANLVAAAITHNLAGKHEVALAEAESALQLTVQTADLSSVALLRQRCHRVLAEALDALGHPAEANRHWAELLAFAPAAQVYPQLSIPDIELFTTRLAYVGSLRRRGRLPEAERALRGLMGDSPPGTGAGVSDEWQAAQVELARIQVMTNDQITARATATAVVVHYEELGLTQHRNALAAREVFAEAQQAIHLWELRPDRGAWTRAEYALSELRDSYRHSHGPRNAFTLAATVAHAQALVSLGRPEQARSELIALMPDLLLRFGVRHPLQWQAGFLLGQVHSQMGEYAPAAEVYTRAYDGQRIALGPGHPHTLRTQFELGITLKVVGQSRRAAAMIRAVRLTAPASVGRNTDLFAQAVLATGLLWLPSWLWHWIATRGKRRG
jgi:tetratricopeptide (TPR) repeat protein